MAQVTEVPEGTMKVSVRFAQSPEGAFWMRIFPDPDNALMCASWEFVKVGDCVEMGGKPAMGLRSVLHTVDPCVVAGAFLPAIQRQGWGTVFLRPEILSEPFAKAAGLDVYGAVDDKHTFLAFDP